MSSKKRIIDYHEAEKIIANEGLAIQNNVWHFTFNNEFLHRNFFYDKRKGIIYSNPINQWAPLLVYCRANLPILQQKNFVTDTPFDKDNKNYRNVFWYLSVTDFDSYLARRSESSLQPHKNFPTIQTYSKKKLALGMLEMKVINFDMEFYKFHFNKLKQPSHLSAEEIYKLTVEDLKALPLKWLKLGCLYHDEKIKAMMLLIDDERSLNYANMASERSKHGYGLWLCTELIKYCAENNYKSFDSGVSGLYGNFKDKIYLDSREIYRKSENSFAKYIEVWKRKYWEKVFAKTKRIFN